MKKVSFCIGAVALLVAIAVGCDNVALKDGRESSVISYDEKVLSLLEKTSVKLFDGVSLADIGLTMEGRSAVLSTELSRRTGRNVSDTDVILSMEEMVGILEAEMSDVMIPELMEPNEEDFITI